MLCVDDRSLFWQTRLAYIFFSTNIPQLQNSNDEFVVREYNMESILTGIILTGMALNKKNT